MLVYDRKTREIIDDHFYNLLDYLKDDTTVVVNNSKVEHCRYLFDGGRTELFAVEKVNDKNYTCARSSWKAISAGCYY